MSQSEMEVFFKWVSENLVGFQNLDCDESQHFYLNDICIGGFARDTRSFFYNQNDELAKALRMMDAANGQ